MKKSLFFSIILCLATHIALAQNSEPLTMEEIIQFQKTKMSETDIIGKIETRGVNFFMNRQTERTLIKNYVSDRVINTISKNPPEGLYLTNVKNRDSVVQFDVQLQGYSSIQEDRYLWFFSHKKELADMWWPQYNVVTVDPETKEYSTMVFLGEQKDVGEWFEVIGLWVSKEDHDTILNYYKTQKSENSTTWPPLSLPMGDPYINVNLFKAGH